MHCGAFLIWVLPSAASHSLRSHACALRGIFSNAHVVGKNDSILIPARQAPEFYCRNTDSKGKNHGGKRQRKQDGHDAHRQAARQYGRACDGIHALSGTLQHCRQRVCRAPQPGRDERRLARLPAANAVHRLFRRHRCRHECAARALAGREEPDGGEPRRGHGSFPDALHCRGLYAARFFARHALFPLPDDK